MKEIFLCEDVNSFNRVYENVANKEQRFFNKKSFIESGIKDVEYIFSTWGMPTFSEQEIKEYLPNLKAVFYSAGTVKNFAMPFLKCGVRIFSSWQANAVPVVEFSVAQIILANKGFYYLSRKCKSDYDLAGCLLSKYNGNYYAKIGILGYGAIGSKVIDELIKHKADIFVYAPNITDERAEELGIKKASLSYIFENCDVISNHMANVPETVKIINEDLINRLKPYSTFINTGRGATVDEVSLIEKLKSDDTITALLDVTDPEPPLKDSELFKLDNVILTPHIAGSSGKEVVRMADYMFEEYERVKKGEQVRYEVTINMLETMA